MKKNHENTLVISDVDGTLVRGSLVLGHACYLHKTGVIDLGLLPERWKRDQKNEELIMTLAESYREATKGMTIEQIDPKGYVDWIVDHASERLYPVHQRLVGIAQAGGDVVLISGSPSYLIEHFAARFGFRHFASEYTVNDAGELDGGCVGMFTSGAKQKVVDNLVDGNHEFVIAFGDTKSDKPLFDSATYSVLVDPNEETATALSGIVDEIIPGN